MVRTWLVLMLALVPLSGCLGDGADTQATIPEEPTVADENATAPAAVSLHVEGDILAAPGGGGWSFMVEDAKPELFLVDMRIGEGSPGGYALNGVRAMLVDPDGTVVSAYDSPLTAGEHMEQILEFAVGGQTVREGEWRIEFMAQSGFGHYELDVLVEYPPS